MMILYDLMIKKKIKRQINNFNNNNIKFNNNFNFNNNNFNNKKLVKMKKIMEITKNLYKMDSLIRYNFLIN